MAIVRDAGTETLRSNLFEGINATAQTLIIGRQHHIYTVISVICFAQGVQTDANFIHMYLVGYDSKAGTSAQGMGIMKQDMSAMQTYVWNDKFSFNGFEGTDYAGNMNSDADQNLIADQASGVAQKLVMVSEGADNIDVICTHLDLNNS